MSAQRGQKLMQAARALRLGPTPHAGCHGRASSPRRLRCKKTAKGLPSAASPLRASRRPTLVPGKKWRPCLGFPPGDLPRLTLPQGTELHASGPATSSQPPRPYLHPLPGYGPHLGSQCLSPSLAPVLTSLSRSSHSRLHSDGTEADIFVFVFPDNSAVVRS